MRYYSSTASPKTLSVAINNSVTSMTVSSTTGFPIPSFPFTLVLDPDTATEEIISVTASAGNVLTIVRAQDGTAAASHSAGAVIKHMVTARDLQEPQNHMNTGVAVHGLTGSVVGTSDTQTLTNKTINIASNTLTGVAPSTSPTFTGIVVLPSTTTIGSVDGTELGYLNGVTSAIQTQIDSKAPIANPTFTGTASALNPAADTNTTQLATTAFVVGQAGTSSPVVNGTAAAGTSLRYSRQDHVHPTDTTRAPLASPTFTGTVVLPSSTSIGNVSSAEIGYLDGAAANLQVQINNSIGGSAALAACVYANTATTSLTSANTWYAISFDTEILDSVSWWTSSASTRITPTVAGYYLVSGSVFGLASATGVSRFAAIRKNGTTLVTGSAFRHTEPTGGFQGAALNLPTNPVIVQMNGSSDYLELVAKSDQASQVTAAAASAEGQANIITVLKVA
jgi:hypothetical protein